MINLYYCNDKAFVWNPNDVITLRKHHHIVGSLVGNYPIKPFQTQTKWLPLQLMHEETKLLIDKGIAKLVSRSKDLPDSTVSKLYFDQRNKLLEDQISVFKENRKQQILDKADKIFEGKKRKYLQTLEKNKKAQKLAEGTVATETETTSVQNTDVESSSYDENNSNLDVTCKENMENEPSKNSAIDEGNNGLKSESQDVDSELINFDKNSVIEEELAKVTGISRELCLVQLFTECPWKTKCEPVNWNYPSTDGEKLRCAVFKDLWEKKYYITSGVKFGGDFLAYEGDPLRYHALFIIVCLSPTQRLQGYDIVTYGRLGQQVKKRVVLSWIDDNGKVAYLTLSWENEMT